MSIAFLVLLLAGSALSQSSSSTKLVRQTLQEYPLAKCNDGSPAAYYVEEASPLKSGSKVLIYLSHDEFGSCSSLSECQSKCDGAPHSCSAPLEDSKVADGGVWSRDRRNNPFARHVKVLLPSCSSDEFSGTRSPPSAGAPFFHGRHILSSVLRDLVAKLRLDRASEVVLVGSGSGARGAARNCDFVSDSLSTVGAAGQRVLCVLDGPDLAPYWVKPERCPVPKDDEAEKVLWGRQDDESCLTENKDAMNSTELATACGTLARSWQHISTPTFVIANQFDQDYFDKFTCGINKRAEDYREFEIGWRQGMLSMVEAMSLAKPGNGWFLPNCDSGVATLLDERNDKERRAVRVEAFNPDTKDDTNENVNVLQTLNNWLSGVDGRPYRAADPFAVPNPECSAARSEPLDLRPDVLKQEVFTTEDLVSGNFRGDFADSFLASGRFAPPADLLPSEYAYGAVSGGILPRAPTDFFDYDDLSLGPRFDLATAEGPLAIAGGPAITSVRSGAVAPPPVVTHAVHAPRPPRVGTAVTHTPGRRRSLWRRLYYLDYLRALYARHYRDYRDEYYGTGLPVDVHVASAPAVAAVPRRAYVAAAPARRRGYHHGRKHGYRGRRRTGYFARLSDGRASQKQQEGEPRTAEFADPNNQVEQIQISKFERLSTSDN